MDLESELTRRSSLQRNDLDWCPRRFDLADERDRRQLAELIEAGEVREVLDTLADQVRELLAARHPSIDIGPASSEMAALLGGTPLVAYGRWVYYPWSRRLVHLLPPAEFKELRSDRNRLKITGEEQVVLARKRIGIVGLSVGQAAALTLLLEGVGGSFRLADFDSLGLSNLNRLRAGAHQLGVNKAILAAREMLEIDPYIDVVPFADGITDENLDRFLLQDGKLDLCIEECDDLYVKMLLRERARALGIPVVMDTSEGGLIDVERFDREPDRPLLHGLLAGLSAAELKGLSSKEKIPFVLRILDASRMSARVTASLVEVKQTLSTWPQLASAVALGGAVVTDVARRLLLGDFSASGRFYVDVAAIVRDGAAVSSPVPDPTAAPPLAVSHAVDRVPNRGARRPSSDEIRYLVAHAVLAPSGGNAQPWRFAYRDDQLLVFLEAGRARTFLDFQHRASQVAIGAAVENISLTAGTLGLHADCVLVPDGDPHLVCGIRFERSGAAEGRPLFDEITRRVTNRRLGMPAPIAADDERALRASVEGLSTMRLDLITGRPELEKIGGILGEVDRLRFLSPEMHHDLVGELRWTPEQARSTRDGLDVATLELSPADAAILRILASAPTMAVLRQVGGGRALEHAARSATASASAVGFLTMEHRCSYVEGGRALERLWLAATARNLAVQPQGVLPFLLARLDHGGAGLGDDQQRTLADLRARLDDLFPGARDRVPLMLLRIAHAGEPTARSLRRPIDEVLTIA